MKRKKLLFATTVLLAATLVTGTAIASAHSIGVKGLINSGEASTSGDYHIEFNKDTATYDDASKAFKAQTKLKNTITLNVGVNGQISNFTHLDGSLFHFAGAAAPGFLKVYNNSPILGIKSITVDYDVVGYAETGLFGYFVQNGENKQYYDLESGVPIKLAEGNSNFIEIMFSCNSDSEITVNSIAIDYICQEGIPNKKTIEGTTYLLNDAQTEYAVLKSEYVKSSYIKLLNEINGIPVTGFAPDYKVSSYGIEVVNIFVPKEYKSVPQSLFDNKNRFIITDALTLNDSLIGHEDRVLYNVIEEGVWEGANYVIAKDKTGKFAAHIIGMPLVTNVIHYGKEVFDTPDLISGYQVKTLLLTYRVLSNNYFGLIIPMTIENFYFGAGNVESALLFEDDQNSKGFEIGSEILEENIFYGCQRPSIAYQDQDKHVGLKYFAYTRRGLETTPSTRAAIYKTVDDGVLPTYDIVIPSKISGIKVADIFSGAIKERNVVRITFEELSYDVHLYTNAICENQELISVIIPARVTRIDSNAITVNPKADIYLEATEKLPGYGKSIEYGNKGSYYYSETSSVNCWHYVDGVPTLW